MRLPNTLELPSGYTEWFQIDLQKNKRLALLVNGLSLLILLIMALPVGFLVPLTSLIDHCSLGKYLVKMVVLLVGTIAYMLLHELVHGICMRLLSGTRPNYGFTGLYAYAGSPAYFNKTSYILIALAPVVVWGIVLGILCWLVPYDWFWIAYFWEIINISGAAGDIYVTLRFIRLPRDIYIQDSGVSMSVYKS